MFKVVVSLAIILGFIWNIIYVDHPETRSYTVAFAGSLVALSPGAVGWWYWSELKKGVPPREILRWGYWRQSRNRQFGHAAQDGGEVRVGLVSEVRRGCVGDLEEGTGPRVYAEVENGPGLSLANTEP